MGVGADVKRVTRRNLLRWGLGAGTLALGLDAFAYEPRALIFDRLDFAVKDLGAAFDGYRIAFITDTHYPRNIDRKFIREAIRVAMEFRPDALLFGGDFIDTKGLGSVPSLAEVFSPADAPDGVYGVLGNHDWTLDMAAARDEIVRTSRIRLLENDNVILRRGDDSLALAGIQDLWGGWPNLTTALKGIPDDVPRILLSHNPDTAEVCPGSGRVDLQLSGHTHGGEVCFPLLGAPYIPSAYGRKFERGLVAGSLHPVYISVGVGSPRGVRFRCRPEVAGITLHTA